MAATADEIVEAMQEVGDTYSDDFVKYLTEKLDAACLNWLRIYGIPETPNDVHRIFSTIYRGLPAALIVEGKMTLTEEALASPEEVEEFRAKRKAKKAELAGQGSLFGDVSPATSNPGQYL